MKAVNLIPTEQRRVQASGKQSGSAYVVVGLLVTLLAMVAAYVVTANSATDRQNQAAAAKSEANRLEAEVAARGNYTNFADIKKQRLVSVMGVAESRFDWERLTRELSRVMPEDSWLQTTDASVTGEIDGVTSTTSASGTPVAATPKAKLVGCTPEQSDVARMMVRMRQLHRVTDVELNESSIEPGDTSEATVSTCGPYYQFDITLSFAETPETEAPRGEASVPASLGGGS